MGTYCRGGLLPGGELLVIGEAKMGLTTQAGCLLSLFLLGVHFFVPGFMWAYYACLRRSSYGCELPPSMTLKRGELLLRVTLMQYRGLSNGGMSEAG